MWIICSFLCKIKKKIKIVICYNFDWRFNPYPAEANWSESALFAIKYVNL